MILRPAASISTQVTLYAGTDAPLILPPEEAKGEGRRLHGEQFGNFIPEKLRQCPKLTACIQ
jgi:hypothetical protein